MDHVHVHGLQTAALEAGLESRERGVLPVFDHFGVVGQDLEFSLYHKGVAVHALDEITTDSLALTGAVDLRGVDVIDAMFEQDFPGFAYAWELVVVLVESGLVAPGPSADDEAGAGDVCVFAAVGDFFLSGWDE